LRATPWLLRSKAIALLPAVTSLRTLRQLRPQLRTTAADPLLAFADPDFGGEGSGTSQRSVRGFSAYFRDGRPLREALMTLPRLPNTRIEGRALALALGASPDAVLLGKAASKEQLLARNRDGRLARVRVLEFATHGLVIGDASGLGEPALALAVGERAEDGLLLASEAAGLHLNADWVLLSACNTASPDASEAEGLSGLARAFFYAGSRALLVSHWRVYDNIAAQLVPAILAAQRAHPGLSRADALRRASLAILDDPVLNAADPAAWAPFTLVGEPGT
jgi:CHAT domain-containing protein